MGIEDYLEKANEILRCFQRMVCSEFSKHTDHWLRKSHKPWKGQGDSSGLKPVGSVSNGRIGLLLPPGVPVARATSCVQRGEGHRQKRLCPATSLSTVR